METQTQQLAVYDEKALAAGTENFQKFYGIIYKTEIDIQNKALNLIGKLWLPENVDQLPLAESLLKELKGGKTDIQTERKVITTKLDGLSSRLMNPEKSLEEPIKRLEAAIIQVKKVHEATEAKRRAKEEERKQIIQHRKDAVNTADANFKTIINNKVAAAYELALGEKNLQPAEVEKYIQEVCSSISEASFPMPRLHSSCTYHTPEEVEVLHAEHFVIDRNSYVLLFAIELENRFSDFEVAFHNKEQALKNAAADKANRAAEIEQDKSNAAVAAKLEAVSTSLPETPTLFTKALKKSYEVDMPETIESVLVIMAAFTANINLCLPKLVVKKWFAFTSAQMATALSKVKCDDNNFSYSGIIFKEVDKL